MAASTPPPLPPDPFAEIKAQFGEENLETILGTYRAFADKVDYRALVSWTMKQPLEELLMPLFLAALVAITKELDLGAVAADLQAAQAAEVERDALAESLAATIADLDTHIERRANEIAQREIAVVAEDCERRIAELKDAEEVIRRLEQIPLRVDHERRMRYLTDADLGRAIYGGDTGRAEAAVRRALPGLLAGLADRLEAE